MDEPLRNRRLCFTYVITFGLLVFFFYNLMENNRTSIMELKRLQEDVNCISQAIKVDCKSKIGGIVKPKLLLCDAPPPFDCGSSHVNDCLESHFKRKVGPLLNNIFALKQEVATAKCERTKALWKLQKDYSLAKPTRINYASLEMGAYIVKVIAKPINGNIFKTLLGIEFSANPPINMLRPSLTPGSCFAFLGSKATVYLSLAYIIRVNGISLTHVAPENTPSRCVMTAPKDFEVYGIAPDDPKQIFLGRWEYKNHAKIRAQVYQVNNEGFYKTLVFVFISNYGANTTCIYSVEVYGDIK